MREIKDPREVVAFDAIYGPINCSNDATTRLPYDVMDKVDVSIQRFAQEAIWANVEDTINIGQMYPMLELMNGRGMRTGRSWTAPLNVSINEFIHRNAKWKPL